MAWSVYDGEVEPYEEVAVAFCRRARGTRASRARRMLAPDLRAELAENDLEDRSDRHVSRLHADGEPLRSHFVPEGSLETWPDKQADDLGWAYVSIEGDDFNEAVYVRVCDVEGVLMIREGRVGVARSGASYGRHLACVAQAVGHAMNEHELRAETMRSIALLSSTKIATDADRWETTYTSIRRAPSSGVLDYPDGHLQARAGLPRLRRLPNAADPRLAHLDAAAFVLGEALAGRASPIVAGRWLVGHRVELGLEEHDPTYLRLVGFCSETDDFDVEDARLAKWSCPALAAKDRELR